MLLSSVVYTLGMDEMTTTARSVLRSEIRLAWDGGDPWGSVLGALGGVCDVLQYNGDGDEIPAPAGYSPGLAEPSVEDYPADQFSYLYDNGYIDTAALAYWARVLDRFADLVPEDQRY